MDSILTVTDSDGYNWYVRKIDNTHIKMSIDKADLNGWVYHIGQLRDNVYYQDIIDFLNNN